VQVRAAGAAFDHNGKGIDPKARLNLADCAAYALARTMDCPLTVQGQRFHGNRRESLSLILMLSAWGVPALRAGGPLQSEPKTSPPFPSLTPSFRAAPAIETSSAVPAEKVGVSF